LKLATFNTVHGCEGDGFALQTTFYTVPPFVNDFCVEG